MADLIIDWRNFLNPTNFQVSLEVITCAPFHCTAVEGVFYYLEFLSLSCPHKSHQFSSFIVSCWRPPPHHDTKHSIQRHFDGKFLKSHRFASFIRILCPHMHLFGGNLGFPPKSHQFASFIVSCWRPPPHHDTKHSIQRHFDRKFLKSHRFASFIRILCFCPHMHQFGENFDQPPISYWILSFIVLW